MGLFLRKSKDKTTLQKLQRKIQKDTIQRNFHLQALRTMLHLLKEFAMDYREIGVDTYNKETDLLRRKLEEERDVKAIMTFFGKWKETVLGFIHKQKGYIEDRDAELREIIDVMSKAIDGHNQENRQYHKSIYKHSEKIERITRLDDLRKIRGALEEEITQLRLDIEKKQSMEKNRMKTLDQKVSSLSHELRKAKKEALRDGLTGLFNRKAFDRFISDLARKSTSRNGTFALMLLDIDDFKKINDTYGHQAGDEILVLMGKKCREIVRSNDFVGRYGGEEFVVVMPASSLRNGVKRGRQIKKAIAATHYKYEMKGADGGSSGITLRITVSIGVSLFKKGDTALSVIERADKALYAAKGAGKNRVTSEKEIK